jgi:hypothetical protein
VTKFQDVVDKKPTAATCEVDYIGALASPAPAPTPTTAEWALKCNQWWNKNVGVFRKCVYDKEDGNGTYDHCFNADQLTEHNKLRSQWHYQEQHTPAVTHWPEAAKNPKDP